MSEYGEVSPALGPWADRLQTASWRGLPFAMVENEIKPGRRTVLHEYPYRDTPWVEDLGLATVRLGIRGFLTGDDVFGQRDAMRTAVDQPGSGEFVHPSLGSIQGNVLNPSFGEGLTGRRVEFTFEFIASGHDAPRYPAATTSTQANSEDAADEADAACGGDFVSDVADALANGVAVVQGVVGTVVGFVAQVVGTIQAVEQIAAEVIALPGEILAPVLAEIGAIAGVINDAEVLVGSVLGLVPLSGSFFGRYGSTGLTAMLPGSATVASQISAAIAASAACRAATGACLSVASAAPLTLPAAVQAAVAATLAAIPAPADQLRTLAVLAGYRAATAASMAPIGAAVATAQLVTAAMIRRAALAALARAAVAYQPTSYDDAAAVRQSLTALLDAEILIAADNGDTASFLALKALRAAVVLDLLTRGSLLPRLTTVTRAVPLPALVLAYQLYGNASRADDLVARVDPPAPLFMPTKFQALSF